jgi:zinc transport system substrate-binding protein
MRLFIFLLLLWPLPSLANIKVVTSIPPLYLITSSIMQGVGEPVILIESQASAHHFAFKPSHLRVLKDADLVIWIDRHFESGFQRLNEILREDTDRIELLRDLGLGGEDGHFWFSPVLLTRAIEHIQSTLARLDPQHSQDYSRNATALSQQIRLWGENTRSQLQTRRPAYLLDHSFLGQFEQDMGIDAVAVLHDANDQPGSLKDLREIEKKLLQKPTKCLLTNQEPASKLALSLARKFDLPIYNITRARVDSDAMPEFLLSLHQLSTTLLNCR